MVSLKGRRVYLDASTVIYAMEGLSDFPNLKVGLLDLLDTLEVDVVTSQLTVLEAIVFPRRHGDAVVEQKFRAFLTPSRSLTISPVSEAVLEKAIDLRSQFPALKTPDAIHLATGILSNRALFVTGDKAWSKTGVAVITPGEVA